MLNVTLEGIQDLDRALKAVGKKAARNAGLVAVQYACKPILVIAKAKARRKSGALADNLEAHVTKYSTKSGKIAGRIGVKYGATGPNGALPYKYDHLIEKGHAKESGGSVPAYPFLRPAIDTGAGEALSIMGKTFGTALSIEIEKLSEVKQARLNKPGKK